MQCSSYVLLHIYIKIIINLLIVKNIATFITTTTQSFVWCCRLWTWTWTWTDWMQCSSIWTHYCRQLMLITAIRLMLVRLHWVPRCPWVQRQCRLTNSCIILMTLSGQNSWITTRSRSMTTASVTFGDFPDFNELWESKLWESIVNSAIDYNETVQNNGACIIGYPSGVTTPSACVENI